jgi:hypothetical protein
MLMLAACTNGTISIESNDAGTNDEHSQPEDGSDQLTDDDGPPPGDQAPGDLSVRLTSPANGATIFGTHMLVALVPKNAGVVRVQFLASPDIELIEVTTGPFQGEIDSSTLTDGEHDIWARAFDANGNQADSNHAQVLIQNQVLSPANEHHVFPDGTSSGDGTMQNPWDLQTALNHPALVQAGDIIWIHEGTYGSGGATVFTVGLDGSENKPIILRSAPGERATINGGIKEGSCSWVIYWGLEITNSSTQRICPPEGRPGGINLYTRGARIINCTVHDAGHPGIGFWRAVRDKGEIYGTLMWGNGLYDTGTSPGTPDNPWTRGSPIYAQNDEGKRFIKDNISFRNFTTGMKAYTEGSFADGFNFEGNIIFNNPDRALFISGSANPIFRLKVIANYILQHESKGKGALTLGYAGTDQNDAIVRDNYVVNGHDGYGAIYAKRWLNLEVQNNIFVASPASISEQGKLTQVESPTAPATVTWDSNQYFGGRSTPFFFDGNGTNFDDWKTAAGYDATSSFSAELPTTNVVAVRPNLYERGRAHVVIINWEGLNQVSVDIADSGLAIGESFEIRDAQNFYGPAVYQDTFNGDLIELPMNLAEISPLVGEVTHLEELNAHTTSRFGTFVVLPML